VKKKGMELSINFLVIIILSLVMLGLGINLLVKVIWPASEDLIPKVTDEIDARLKTMLVANQRLAVYPSHLEVNRKQSDRFSLGILNTDPSRPFFVVNVACKRFIDSAGNTFACDSANLRLLYNGAQKKIENNDKVTQGIGIEVKPGAPSGNYELEVSVCSGNPTISSCDANSPFIYTDSVIVYVDVP